LENLERHILHRKVLAMMGKRLRLIAAMALVWLMVGVTGVMAQTVAPPTLAPPQVGVHPDSEKEPSTTPIRPAPQAPRLQPAPGASASLGGEVFRRDCARCHAIERGETGSLRGVFNAGAGQRPGTTATSALKYSGKIWNSAQLDQFLADPVKDLPGTTMQGIKETNEDDRRNVIAYLMTLQ
jgi:cytochrome c